MNNKEKLQISLVPNEKAEISAECDLNRVIFDLDNQISLLSNRADNIDYLIAIASGVLCGALDILWVGDFNLERGRAFASDEIDEFVKKQQKCLDAKTMT